MMLIHPGENRRQLGASWDHREGDRDQDARGRRPAAPVEGVEPVEGAECGGPALAPWQWTRAQVHRSLCPAHSSQASLSQGCEVGLGAVSSELEVIGTGYGLYGAVGMRALVSRPLPTVSAETS